MRSKFDIEKEIDMEFKAHRNDIIDAVMHSLRTILMTSIAAKSDNPAKFHYRAECAFNVAVNHLALIAKAVADSNNEEDLDRCFREATYMIGFQLKFLLMLQPPITDEKINRAFRLIKDAINADKISVDTLN